MQLSVTWNRVTVGSLKSVSCRLPEGCQLFVTWSASIVGHQKSVNYWLHEVCQLSVIWSLSIVDYLKSSDRFRRWLDLLALGSVAVGASVTGRSASGALLLLASCVFLEGLVMVLVGGTFFKLLLLQLFAFLLLLLLSMAMWSLSRWETGTGLAEQQVVEYAWHLVVVQSLVMVADTIGVAPFVALAGGYCVDGGTIVTWGKTTGWLVFRSRSVSS